MNSALESFEKSERRKLLASGTTNLMPPRYGRAFLLGLLVTPFALSAFLFVPFLGQLLGVSGCLLSLVYFWRRRSLTLTLSGIAGVATSIICLIVVTTNFWKKVEIGGYFVLGFSTAVMIAFSLYMAGAIWWDLEQQQSASGKGEPL